MKFLLLTILVFRSFLAFGNTQHTEKNTADNTFAIVVDDGTLSACRNNIDRYKQLLCSEGLAAVIVHSDWKTPEQVKEKLIDLYNNSNLSGAVFIGDIPIAMVRRAQHLTSAFKMDEKVFPIFESSVPSDRFYDDFNLKFNFIAQDSVRKNLFYYNLSGDSPQAINCNIYTGRIKPTKKGAEGYGQINDYLNKLIKERTSTNYLDHVTSYTGEGSFSNCLIAWKDEQITLAEQMPMAFNSNEGARFYIYAMYPHMKEVLEQELRRDDLDYMVFHEHGDTEVQYMTGTPKAMEDESFFENAKMYIREKVKRYNNKPEKLAGYKDRLVKKYGLMESWFEPDDLADSLETANRRFYTKDIRSINPNPRMVNFDACYNGNFRDTTSIAQEYIFGSGSTVVTFGNSVNVLQDKSSSDLLGLLSCGARVGEWAQNINILESHIIGDPTFRFATKGDDNKVEYRNSNVNYWLGLLKDAQNGDIKGLSLHKLYKLGYGQLPQLLLDTYKSSDSYMLRLQCMHLLSHYKGDYYSQLLVLAAKDPYEFIRRKAAYYMSLSGNKEYLPVLAQMYILNSDARRIVFNIGNKAGMFDKGALKETIDSKIKEGNYFFNPDGFCSDIYTYITQSEHMTDYALENINAAPDKLKSRLLGVSLLRNNPYPQALKSAFEILENEKELPELRIAVAEALGWYNYSMHKEYIAERCKRLLGVLEADKEAPHMLVDELRKTVNRLNEFLR